MLAVQLGLILFLIFILAVVGQDERKKKSLTRKSAAADRFWQKTQERRLSLRINTKIDVSYEVVPASADKKYRSVSRNLSVGGINLALKEKLNPGTVIELDLELFENHKPIHAQGKIIWVKKISDKFIKETTDKFFATGIEFLRLHPKDEGFLRSFISKRID